MTRLINFLLLTAFIVGTVFAVQAESERRVLQSDFNRHSAAHGHMPIKDESKIHIVRLETDDPMHFRFRVYLPANHAYSWKSLQQSSHGMPSTEPRDFVLQARLRYDEKRDELVFFHSGDSGSGLSYTNFEDSGKFIVENWDRLDIAVASEGEIETFDTDEVLDIVRVKMLESLFDEFKEKFPRVAKYYSGNVIYLTLGTNEAYERAEKKAKGVTTQ